LKSYLETSFLASLYSADANSAAALRYLPSVEAPFPWTGFIELELTNAIELRVFRREITRPEAGAALMKLAAHIERGVFRTAEMSATVYETARSLARRHTAKLGVRTLDILHVAMALELGAPSFYTFDRRQSRLAQAEGLVTPVRIR
jgi:predicted nucleic acid-binding protein